MVLVWLGDQGNIGQEHVIRGDMSFKGVVEKGF